MPLFIDTRGHSTLAIGICARCSRKFPRDELHADPNFPGLFVCDDDMDHLDPYRLPAREADVLTVDQPRPDVALVPNGPTLLFGNLKFPGFDISQLQAAVQWQPNTFYKKGQTVYVGNVDDQNVTLPVIYLVCLADGFSGSTPPTHGFDGVVFRDGK